jgi:hypothetical protein
MYSLTTTQEGGKQGEKHREIYIKESTEDELFAADNLSMHISTRKTGGHGCVDQGG